MSQYFSQQVPICMGTFPLKGNELATAIKHAFEAGYRGFDTAQMYENEATLGSALTEIGCPRESLFLTTKVLPAHLDKNKFMVSVEESLRALKTDYVDVLLLHWPTPSGENREALELLQQAANKGYAKSIGVSNYTIEMLEEACATLDDMPVCNQVEFHPYLDQSKLFAAATRLGIALSAYCPLAKGRIFGDPVINALAAKYDRSEAQIILRWIVQKGVSANPMSTKPENLSANLEAVNFNLSAPDSAAIDRLGKKGLRIVDKDRMPIAPEWD